MDWNLLNSGWSFISILFTGVAVYINKQVENESAAEDPTEENGI